MKNAKVKAHSMAWWEGYLYKGPVTRNPYKAKVDAEQLAKEADWRDGWARKFHGEQP